MNPIRLEEAKRPEFDSPRIVTERKNKVNIPLLVRQHLFSKLSSLEVLEKITEGNFFEAHKLSGAIFHEPKPPFFKAVNCPQSSTDIIKDTFIYLNYLSAKDRSSERKIHPHLKLIYTLLLLQAYFPRFKNMHVEAITDSLNILYFRIVVPGHLPCHLLVKKAFSHIIIEGLRVISSLGSYEEISTLLNFLRLNLNDIIESKADCTNQLKVILEHLSAPSTLKFKFKYTVYPKVRSVFTDIPTPLLRKKDIPRIKALARFIRAVQKKAKACRLSSFKHSVSFIQNQNVLLFKFIQIVRKNFPLVLDLKGNRTLLYVQDFTFKNWSGSYEDQLFLYHFKKLQQRTMYDIQYLNFSSKSLCILLQRTKGKYNLVELNARLVTIAKQLFEFHPQLLYKFYNLFKKRAPHKNFLHLNNQLAIVYNKFAKKNKNEKNIQIFMSKISSCLPVFGNIPNLGSRVIRDYLDVAKILYSYSDNETVFDTHHRKEFLYNIIDICLYSKLTDRFEIIYKALLELCKITSYDEQNEVSHLQTYLEKVTYDHVFYLFLNPFLYPKEGFLSFIKEFIKEMNTCQTKNAVKQHFFLNVSATIPSLSCYAQVLHVLLKNAESTLIASKRTISFYAYVKETFNLESLRKNIVSLNQSNWGNICFPPSMADELKVEIVEKIFTHFHSFTESHLFDIKKLFDKSREFYMAFCTILENQKDLIAHYFVLMCYFTHAFISEESRKKVISSVLPPNPEIKNEQKGKNPSTKEELRKALHARIQRRR